MKVRNGNGMTRSVRRWISAFLALALALGLCAGDAQAARDRAKARKITLNYTSVEMRVGAKLALRVTSVTPVGASAKVTWKSSKKGVASVNKKGVVTARKKGTSIITAKPKSGGKAAKCKVKVTAGEAAASNVLVAYFSATGTTRAIAGKVAGASGGTLLRITPAKRYSSKDLDYMNDSCRASREQGDRKARPSLKGKAPDLRDYDTVFVGYPIWYGKAPRAVLTFLESQDFSGKTVIPFCTSASSGIGGSLGALMKSSGEDTLWQHGRRFDGDETWEEVAEWVGGLGLAANGGA